MEQSNAYSVLIPWPSMPACFWVTMKEDNNKPKRVKTVHLLAPTWSWLWRDFNLQLWNYLREWKNSFVYSDRQLQLAPCWTQWREVVWLCKPGSSGSWSVVSCFSLLWQNFYKPCLDRSVWCRLLYLVVAAAVVVTRSVSSRYARDLVIKRRRRKRVVDYYSFHAFKWSVLVERYHHLPRTVYQR